MRHEPSNSSNKSKVTENNNDENCNVNEHDKENDNGVLKQTYVKSLIANSNAP